MTNPQYDIAEFIVSIGGKNAHRFDAVELDSVNFGDHILVVTHSSITIGDYDGYTVRESGGTIDLTVNDFEVTYWATFERLSEVRLYRVERTVTVWDVIGLDRSATHPVHASWIGKTVLWVEDDTDIMLSTVRYVEAGPELSFAIEKEPDDTRYAPNRYAALAVVFD